MLIAQEHDGFDSPGGSVRCDICGAPGECNAFLVRVRVPGGRVDVQATHCDPCDVYFRVRRARRVQAIAITVLAAMLFAPIAGLASSVFGAAAPIVSAVLVIALIVTAIARAATWHDRLRQRMGDRLLDDLARGVPEVQGALGSRDVQLFASLPHDAAPKTTLRAVRQRAERTRALPN
ncbi:hypothetical protein [Sandaracinus amylolyticus]|uniref:hypothetical protein n=1 Tax=Sandaracinus amylolyticus TaxID=927083 RepID=UPI001F2D229F|nr:hypothetical protein [Sandaracinus amylolyticus]UJR79498.1 Hypothetical protein I5071_15340 [Sandaracinus amylolyticus]